MPPEDDGSIGHDASWSHTAAEPRQVADAEAVSDDDAMAVMRPEEMNGAFAEAVNSGDVGRVLALYEREALLAPRPGQRASGLEEISAALEELLSLGGTMASRNVWCMQVGELALLQGEWHLSGTAPDGSPLELSSRTAEVVRRQPDGSWLYVIDHAFGED
jgi:ketosteroid isomerase-like protein